MTSTNSGNPKRAKAWLFIWPALVMVAVMSAVGFGIAYLHASSAIRCTNDALGSRSNVGQQDATINRVLHRPAATLVTDSDANRAVYAELLALQHAGRPATPAERTEFFQVITHARAVLDADQAFRVDHPIGSC